MVEDEALRTQHGTRCPTDNNLEVVWSIVVHDDIAIQYETDIARAAPRHELLDGALAPNGKTANAVGNSGKGLCHQRCETAVIALVQHLAIIPSLLHRTVAAVITTATITGPILAVITTPVITTAVARA